ncbi:MAG: hypothetical protein ACK4RV_15915 [Caulobacter sp.]
MAKRVSLLIAAIIALPTTVPTQPGKDAVTFGCRPVADVKADPKQRGVRMFAISARRDARHLVDKSVPWETFVMFSVDPTGSIGYGINAAQEREQLATMLASGDAAGFPTRPSRFPMLTTNSVACSLPRLCHRSAHPSGLVRWYET